MDKKEKLRQKLCNELGDKYLLKDVYSFKQIYRKLDEKYHLEIGFFDLKQGICVVLLLKENSIVEAVYSVLESKAIELAAKSLVEKYSHISLI